MNYQDKLKRFKSLPKGYEPEKVEAADLLWLMCEIEWAWKAMEQFAAIQVPPSHSDCVMLLGELKQRAAEALGVK